MMLPAQPYLLDVRDAAVVLQSQLAKLNIKINMRVTEQSVLQDALLSGNNVSALQVWLSPGDPTFVIDLCYGKNNNIYTKSSGYESAALWQTIQESYAEDDPKALKPIFERMQQILAQDSPHIWMGFVHVANLWRDSVKGFKVSQGLTMNVREVEKT
jgi:peptide/nickel transport system substrate-binding protein